ncbi:rhomboid family intramembrane serine protease [Gordonia phosphorivorans]|uniref:Rhomboid family intramembrane serine protease n=1 Tax=Gordonia phosphorivorans TaxID=1056982 RepID=A0ABV6HB60_9ACTN
MGQHCLDCLAQEAGSARVGTTVPVEAEDRSTATPYVTYGLIGVNLVLFLACLVQAGGTDLIQSSVMRAGLLPTGYYLDFEYWRLFTSGFLHWSVTHILVNMVSLYIIGRDLERLFGPARYLMIYVTSLLGGSAAVLALQSGLSLTAGASGAIYGLMGALLVVVVRLKLPTTSLLVVIGFNIIISWSIPGISLWGHLGGLLFGALGALAVLWLPIVVVPAAQRTAAKVTRVGWFALGGLFVVALGAGLGLVSALSL